jgi:hypothetical protein
MAPLGFQKSMIGGHLFITNRVTRITVLKPLPPLQSVMVIMVIRLWAKKKIDFLRTSVFLKS